MQGAIGPGARDRGLALDNFNIVCVSLQLKFIKLREASQSLIIQIKFLNNVHIEIFSFKVSFIARVCMEVVSILCHFPKIAAVRTVKTVFKDKIFQAARQFSNFNFHFYQQAGGV